MALRTGNPYPLEERLTLIGRHDPVTGVHPEIDLSQEEMGKSVSRRHAKIEYRDGQFFLTEEIGTLNNTTVNGAKLETGVMTPLLDGDEITLGVGRVQRTFEIAGVVRSPAAPARLEFTLADSESNAATVELLVSVDGATPTPAANLVPLTGGAVSNGVLSDLATDPVGVPHVVEWNYSVTGSPTVVFILRPSDANAGGPEVSTAPFVIGNTAPARKHRRSGKNGVEDTSSRPGEPRSRAAPPEGRGPYLVSTPAIEDRFQISGPRFVDRSTEPWIHRSTAELGTRLSRAPQRPYGP